MGLVDAGTGQELVRVDLRYFRPTEIDELVGDASKARRSLGWAPETSFSELVAKMVNSDLKTVAAEAGRKDRVAYKLADPCANVLLNRWRQPEEAAAVLAATQARVPARR